MKKNTKVAQNTKKNAVAKNILVKPFALYTKDEVRDILHISKGTCLSPKYYPGMGGRGNKVPGSAVIAYLERAKNVKVGRRYASGTVTVVAR